MTSPADIERQDAGAKPPGAVAVVGVSVSALAAATFAISSIGVLAPKLQSSFNLSRAGVGLLTSLMFLGAALGSGPAGKLTDRRHPARVLGFSMAAFAGAVARAAWSSASTVPRSSPSSAHAAARDLFPPQQ